MFSVCMAAGLLALAGCGTAAKNPDGTPTSLADRVRALDMHDPAGGLTREDYYDTYFKKSRAHGKTEAAKPQLVLPGMGDLMMAPEAPALPDDKLVTLMVTEDVPLKDVLLELARRADVDMEIDPSITGGVILSARDKPFSEIIERIANLANLKYSFDRGVLKVERDTAQIHNYRINVPNVVRTSTASVTSGTSLSGEGTNSGSTNQINITGGNSDLWAMIQEGITNILARYRPENSSGSAVPEGAGGGGGGGSGSGGNNSAGLLSLNQQAGILSVMATERQHRAITTYLDSVHKAMNTQVLIEAKVMEVTLDDQFRSGIDWSFLSSSVTDMAGGADFSDLGNMGELADQTFTAGILPANLFGFDNTSIAATLQLVEQFGSTRTLSSPRISAMNNQQATLTFAENFVYFELEVEQSQDTETNAVTVTIDSTINTVPVGVILNILPSIDLERDEVILNVRPTLTRISELREDPGFRLQAAQLGIDDLSTEVPVVDVRELDSVMRIKNGEVMVIGGLMEEKSENVDRGIPGLAGIPVVGNLFKGVKRLNEVVETVIFIKATIVPAEGMSQTDKDFYNKFSVERAPFKL